MPLDGVRPMVLRQNSNRQPRFGHEKEHCTYTRREVFSRQPSRVSFFFLAARYQVLFGFLYGSARSVDPPLSRSLGRALHLTARLTEVGAEFAPPSSLSLHRSVGRAPTPSHAIRLYTGRILQILKICGNATSILTKTTRSPHSRNQKPKFSNLKTIRK